LWRAAGNATDGTWLFYAWMFVLTAVALVGVNAWANQMADGMALTGMGDHVSWGLYIANFTFLVGLAAGGVMMVIPAYVYRDHEMHEVVIVGEILAVAAIVMALLFVNVDIGRLDRMWHLTPGLGQLNWPMSMLTWDILVLGTYLLLSLYISGYLIYRRFLGRAPNPRHYVPFVLVSIVWAISIHTVTAFLYCGLGGRTFWNSALMAPRFLASAFVAGPAFVVLTLQVVQRLRLYDVPEAALYTLLKIMQVTVVVNLFLLFCELFTHFYTGGHHSTAVTYLFFGTHGHSELVPWIWTAVTLNVAAAAVLLIKRLSDVRPLLNAALVATFVGVWIEKGMGLIVPGFVPSTLDELVPYAPSLTEWKVTAGIWAFGLLVFTVAIKLALATMGGELRLTSLARAGRTADDVEAA
jgi:molybdopterin-containing oxidoreductase family membrane subunit